MKHQHQAGRSDHPLSLEELAAKRKTRFSSPALVDIHPFRFLPLFTRRAVLLDISEVGFKIEFSDAVTSKPGQIYWLSIPLTPLGIPEPTKLTCKIECRWFDPKKFRVGGTFVGLSAKEKLLMELVVEKLRKKAS